MWCQTGHPSLPQSSGKSSVNTWGLWSVYTPASTLSPTVRQNERTRRWRQCFPAWSLGIHRPGPNICYGGVRAQHTDQLHHGPIAIPVCSWVLTSSLSGSRKGVFLSFCPDVHPWPSQHVHVGPIWVTKGLHGYQVGMSLNWANCLGPI